MITAGTKQPICGFCETSCGFSFEGWVITRTNKLACINCAELIEFHAKRLKDYGYIAKRCKGKEDFDTWLKEMEEIGDEVIN